MLTRRNLLAAGGAILAGGLARPVRAADLGIVEIRMRSDREGAGAHVGFDPIGLLVSRGQTVRWICDEGGNVHTATAYHPANDHHSLRIPQAATPWDSDFLLPGQSFEVSFEVEGVYDYYCRPHEHAGMVGRIIVGQPTGPGSLPFDYFAGRPEARDWVPVPAAARSAFPALAEIMRRTRVPGPAV